MHATGIVGYTYNADQYHPWCVAETLAPEDTVKYGNEVALDRLAESKGVDRNDERSYDSSEFPKVILASQVEDGSEICGACGEALIP